MLRVGRGKGVGDAVEDDDGKEEEEGDGETDQEEGGSRGEHVAESAAAARGGGGGFARWLHLGCGGGGREEAAAAPAPDAPTTGEEIHTGVSGSDGPSFTGFTSLRFIGSRRSGNAPEVKANANCTSPTAHPPIE